MPASITITRVSGFGRGKSEAFDPGEILLGTDPDCQLQFDPTWEKTVAGRHARIVTDSDGETRIEDLGSEQGIWMEGRRVEQAAIDGVAEVTLGEDGPGVRIEVPLFEPVRAETTDRTEPAPAPDLGPEPLVSAAHEAAIPRPTSRAGMGGGMKAGLIAGSILLFAAGVAGWFWFLGGRTGLTTSDSDTRLQLAAKRYEESVGLVVISTPAGSEPYATAWAVGKNVFATNAHVAIPASEALESGFGVFVVSNRNPDRRYRVVRAVTHQKHRERNLNLDGKAPAVSAFDVGLLYIEGEVPEPFKLASSDVLRKLDSGTRVAFIGFPMEGMAGDGVNFRNPVATMQSGIITSVTDFWLGEAEYSERLLIQHNLGAVGGASGSPVFDVEGRVVGILSAGNVIGAMTTREGATVRIPSAAMVNFAQRVDLVKELLEASQ